MNRADSLKRVLVREFSIPSREIETVGYGEDYLLVQTPYEEWQTRRVTLRRVEQIDTGILAYVDRRRASVASELPQLPKSGPVPPNVPAPKLRTDTFRPDAPKCLYSMSNSFD